LLFTQFAIYNGLADFANSTLDADCLALSLFYLRKMLPRAFYSLPGLFLAHLTILNFQLYVLDSLLDGGRQFS